MSNPSITADKTPWYQWDTGLTVTVSGGEMNECHFANRKQGTAYVQAVINGVARVPDELLQVAAPIKAYGYVSDGAGGQTYVEQTFDVIARNIPSDYTYTKTAQKTIRDAEVARDHAVQAAKDAKASELAADDSAIEASMSAQSAGDSASAASTSASNAAKSAGDAATSASDAKAAASKAVDDASELLKTYTDNAKTSADNAATSASNAADAASAASGSASAAEQSATDASNAKVAAETAKAGAETAANNAATSASNAESSATAAANSASDAAASVDAINVISPKIVPKPAISYAVNEVAIGMGASTTGGYGIAIGQESRATIGSVAIGSGAVADGGARYTSLAIGDATAAHGQKSVAAGSGSIANNNNEFSIGIPKIGSGQEYTREITHVSTPTAETSAATKQYTDDNDVKTLTEAKKYTDANTSNALVGNASGKLMHVEDAWPGKPLGLTIDGAYKQDGTPSPENPVQIEVIENPVMKVTGADTSAIGATLPITLPAEHPYLAALPDGTHDEIVIDKGGNASLVARVGKVLVGEQTISVYTTTTTPYATFSLITLPSVENALACNTYKPEAYSDVSGTIYSPNGTDIVIRDSRFTSLEVAKEALADTVLYYYITAPVTYNLGKLDIPSLPDTISNVWTDAELTTNMSMTYKRDINIAFDNLVQSVVAAAAGE